MTQKKLQRNSILDEYDLDGDNEITNEELKQAKEIYCFEPDQENFIMVKKNCENINNIKIFNSALISGQQKEINFYKTKGINKGNFSTVEFRGRNITTVKSQNFNEIL